MQEERQMSQHIFPVSAVMVGSCITALGLFNINESLRKIESVGDECFGFVLIIFAVSCALSYISLRTNDKRYAQKLERWADVLFLAALIATGLVGGAFLYELL